MNLKKLTMLFALALALLASGCAGRRPARSQGELMQLRKAHDELFAKMSRDAVQQLMQTVKVRYDRHPNDPPVVDLLVVSGGGDWGAFGAGFLKGWSRVQGPLARPRFDVVTGVSTGALISPFAFLGDNESIDTIERLYRDPKKDWVKKRGPLYFLPSHESLATTPGLERDVRRMIDPALVRRIADQSTSGRQLLVNTTDLDDGGMWVWDLGHEAEQAAQNGNIDRVHRVFLASSGIPGAFPFREINGSPYVDGGVTGNILYGGRFREDQSLPAVWAANYPNLPVPKVRFWVIFNNRLRPLPQVTEPTWIAVVSRSIEMGTRASTITAMRHLFAQAEISRMKRGGEFEVRVAAVPNDFVPPKAGTFVKETMNALADLGERMGADTNSWLTKIP